MGKSIPKKRDGRFIAIPHAVMRSEDYRRLSGSAVKLLNALVYQYNGKNNGDLTAAWKVMFEQHGFRSKDTLSRALKQLQAANLIVRTREAYFQNPNNRCALYAITWKPIDECYGKHLDIKPTSLPVRKFSAEKLNHLTRNPYTARPENRTDKIVSDPKSVPSQMPSVTETGAEA